ncbi:MAG: signal recognition particle protein, partial [Chloroflexota bacterium]|nr:signal recognition particle protein [Chloroflexota bacterium]
IRYVTGVPIKFMGVGEKVDDLEPFYPDRLASRILGMGDMLTFIEKADKAMDQQQIKQWQKKMNTASFDVEDTLAQLRQVKKMGSLNSLVEMLPGFSQFASRLPGDAGESQLRKVEAIILSMTPDERRNPAIINGSRRHRIAAGSGTTTKDVNQFLSQFYQIQKLTRMMKRGRLPKGMPGISFHPGHSR